MSNSTIGFTACASSGLFGQLSLPFLLLDEGGFEFSPMSRFKLCLISFVFSELAYLLSLVGLMACRSNPLLAAYLARNCKY
jgi:hypothetical protein